MDGKVMCDCACECYLCLDDGEGFPPNQFCEAAEAFLDDDGQECLAPDRRAIVDLSGTADGSSAKGVS